MKFTKKFYLVQSKPPATLKNPKAKNKDDILKFIPKSIKTKAETILDSLNPDVLTWDDKLSLIYKGQKIPKTNIVDNIRTAAFDYKNLKARGQKEFLSALREENIPATYLSSLRNLPGKRGVERKHTTTAVEKKKTEKEEPIEKVNWIKL